MRKPIQFAMMKPKIAYFISLGTFLLLCLLYAFLHIGCPISNNPVDWVTCFSFIAIIPTLECAFFTYIAATDVQNSVDKSAEETRLLTKRMEILRQLNESFSQCISEDSPQLVDRSSLEKLRLELELLKKTPYFNTTNIPFLQMFKTIDLLENSYRDDFATYADCPGLKLQISNSKKNIKDYQITVRKELLSQIFN